MMGPTFRLVAGAIALVALGSCKAEPIGPSTAVASVTLEPAGPVVGVGATAPLTATPRDASGQPLSRAVTWSSSSTAVATVDLNGVVHGVGPGTTTITATSEEKSASLTLIVSTTPVASVTVAPTTGSVNVGATIALTGTAKDAGGAILAGRVFAWGTANAAIATVTAAGVVRGVAGGTVTITGTSEGKRATASITVIVPPVASIVIQPASPSVGIGDSLQLKAVLKDAAGDTLTGRTVRWQTSDTAIATVSGTGLVRGRRSGSATITATSEGVNGTAAVPVRLRFTAVSAGRDFSCGVTPLKTAYCWGHNFSGSLGTGTALNTATPTLVSLPAGVTFDSVSAGQDHACGLTPAGAVYCWGTNTFGQLGDGTTNSSSVPVAVATPAGLVFTHVSAGARFSCARAPTQNGATINLVYCWGLNSVGQLCNAFDLGTLNPNSTPLVVQGGPFTDVSAGFDHACSTATTPDNRALCWGNNSSGQLGQGGGASPGTVDPTAVQGAAKYAFIASGVAFSCGIQTDGETFCWGSNGSGQIGTTTTDTIQTFPTVIDGGLTWQNVSAGQALACGVSQAGAGYCWGANDFGQLGIGISTPQAFGPHAVTGSLTFKMIDAGYFHACGVTTTNRAYCWGRAQDGANVDASDLGNGASTPSNAPVAVSGQN